MFGKRKTHELMTQEAQFAPSNRVAETFRLMERASVAAHEAEQWAGTSLARVRRNDAAALVRMARERFNG